MTDKPCKLCGVRLQPRFLAVTDPITLERFDVLACPGCGLGATYPTPPDLSPYYGERYYGERHWITTAYCVWRRLRVVKRSIDRFRQHSILDVGCGDGAFLAAAQRKGWKVSGTEINLTLPASGIHVWPILGEIDARFDCITSWHVLEHLHDPLACLRAMKRLLARGGVLIIAVPNAGGLQSCMFGRYWFHLDVPRHLFHFDMPSTRLLLETAGFQVLDVWHHELEYDVFGWIQSALNCVLRVPNVLFDFLTGRPNRTGFRPIGFSLLFAVIALPAAFALTVISTLVRRGGTLIVTAGPRGNGLAGHHDSIIK